MWYISLPISSVSRVICGLSGPAGRRTRDYPLQGNTIWRKRLHWNQCLKGWGSSHGVKTLSFNCCSPQSPYVIASWAKMLCPALHCHKNKSYVTSGDRDSEGLSRFLPSRAKCPWQQVNRGDQYKVNSLEKSSLYTLGLVIILLSNPQTNT